MQQCRRFPGLSPKLSHKWTGPYYVTEVTGRNTVKLRWCSSNKDVRSRINITRLRKYYDPDDRLVPPPPPPLPVECLSDVTAANHTLYQTNPPTPPTTTPPHNHQPQQQLLIMLMLSGMQLRRSSDHVAQAVIRNISCVGRVISQTVGNTTVTFHQL